MFKALQNIVKKIPQPVLLTIKTIWFSVLVLTILLLADREHMDFIYWDQ